MEKSNENSINYPDSELRAIIESEKNHHAQTERMAYEEFNDMYFNLLHKSFVDLYTTKILRELKPYMTGKPLVDLGGGNGLTNSKLNTLGITRCTIVDLHEITLPRSKLSTHVREDALEHLLKLPDNYGVNIMSNGFLTTDIFGQAPQSKKYLDFLFQNIGRVIGPDSVFVASHFDLDTVAKANGLEPIKFPSRNIKVFRAA